MSVEFKGLQKMAFTYECEQENKAIPVKDPKFAFLYQQLAYYECQINEYIDKLSEFDDDLAEKYICEEEITSEDFLNSTSKGSYIKLGANYNAYKNWLDMNNEIFVGFRYGFSVFDQTLNSYTPNVNNNYFLSNTITTPITETGLTAHWAEAQLGIKAETFKNLFIGFSFSYKVGISIDDQKGFKTLYAPGFNRVFESNTGFGFNYTISYLIPFVNK